MASTRPTGLRGRRFVFRLVRDPLWLFGWLALAGAFACQALALHSGQLSVVQPLLVTELIFVLVLRRVWVQQSIRGVTWTGAALASAGLAVFLVAAEPHGGTASPTTSSWVLATALTAGAAGLLVLLALPGRSPPRKAVLFASATGICWALVATFMKTATDVFSGGGLSGLFSGWPVYALAGAGLTAEILTQVTLHVGPLSFSQPFLVVVDPLASIALGVAVFDEHFTVGTLAVVAAVMGFAVMCGGVFLLSGTAPPTIQPAPRERRPTTPAATT